MLVLEYRTFIAPKRVQSELKPLLNKRSETDFTLPSHNKAASLPSSIQRPDFPNYIQNRNYFANKRRFEEHKERPKAVEDFQHLSKLQQLPKAYSTPFTSFLDLTKPKKAVVANHLETTQKVDKHFITLSILDAHKRANIIYLYQKGGCEYRDYMGL